MAEMSNRKSVNFYQFKMRFFNNFEMKYLCLVVLTLHCAVLGLSMRFVRTKPGDMFLPSTAVIMTEIVKLCVCLGFVFLEEDRSVRKMMTLLKHQVLRRPWDTIKVCVPSCLFVIQNNLLYVSASHLDAASYQVTYQLKILSTALCSLLILRRRLLATQWTALLVLFVGVVMVQIAETTPSNVRENRLLGGIAALGASVLSGLAGVLLEKMLKESTLSVWVRNVQLSFLSLPLALLTAFLNDLQEISDRGFFFGYDGFVIYVIFLQALGGLIVAMVIKYADNILKNFATALGIVLICVVSNYWFDFVYTLTFIVGAILVMASIYLYSYSSSGKKIISQKQAV